MTSRVAALSFAALLLLAASPGTGRAQGACSEAEHRRFDFWVGSWEVEDRSRPDAPPAFNRITLRDGGCTLLEEYRTAGGFTGTSLSFYDARTGHWHQTWRDISGTVLRLKGGWEVGRMVLRQIGERGRVDEIAWTPEGAHTVNQVWRRSSDGGRTWEVIFDGVYSRRSPTQGRSAP